MRDQLVRKVSFAGIGISALAIGVPLEDVGAHVDAGIVHVISGKGGKGLVKADVQKWSQKDLPGKAEPGDGFGRVAAPIA